MTLRHAPARLITVADVRAFAGTNGCGCISPFDTTDETIEDLIDAASDIIALVSGGTIAGRRRVKARPCRSMCSEAECPCCGADVIPLGEDNPGDNIIVKINGETLTLDEVWLHRDQLGWVLARRTEDGLRLRSWPSTQRRWLPDTEDHTFSIEFDQNIFVDQHIITAAALEIVCDLASDGSVSQNVLDGVTSVSYGDAQVTIDPNRLAEAADTRLNRIANGELGPMTRRMMGILAPSGRAHSSVWAPELTQGWEMHLEIA